MDRIPLVRLNNFVTVNTANKKITFLRPPVSVPLISLDQ